MKRMTVFATLVVVVLLLVGRESSAKEEDNGLVEVSAKLCVRVRICDAPVCLDEEEPAESSVRLCKELVSIGPVLADGSIPLSIRDNVWMEEKEIPFNSACRVWKYLVFYNSEYKPSVRDYTSGR